MVASFPVLPAPAFYLAAEGGKVFSVTASGVGRTGNEAIMEAGDSPVKAYKLSIRRAGLGT